MVKTFSDFDMEPDIIFLNTEEDSLLYFFLTLHDHIYKNWRGVPDIDKYLDDLTFEDF